MEEKELWSLKEGIDAWSTLKLNNNNKNETHLTTMDRWIEQSNYFYGALYCYSFKKNCQQQPKLNLQGAQNLSTTYTMECKNTCSFWGDPMKQCDCPIAGLTITLLLSVSSNNWKPHIARKANAFHVVWNVCNHTHLGIAQGAFWSRIATKRHKRPGTPWA